MPDMKKIYFERVPRAQVLGVDMQNLQDAFAAIESDWRAHLRDSGIKLPATHSAKRHQLAVLKHFHLRAVHKDDISALLAKLTGKPARDQQVRHLKTQNGWHVLNRGDSHRENRAEKFTPDGCHVLISTRMPSPSSVLQRRAAVRDGDWQKILRHYGNKCASCGTAIGEYHRYDRTYKVETLERGHMNPKLPLTPGNIIPQCRWCNRTARGDFVFDEHGRPRTVASVRPVARAALEVREEIGAWLHQQKK